MPKRISKGKKDVNQIASAVVALATMQEEPPKIAPEVLSRIMSEMGRKGGKIGGKRRLETMTAAERSRVARKAAKARWKEHV
jgi:hypothetical protein